MRTAAKAITVTVAAGAVAIATSGAANAATGMTITVKATETSSKLIKDTPPKNVPNPGDKFAFTEKLVQSGKQVGTDRVVETIPSSGAPLIDGIWTFTSGTKGTLHVHGALSFNPATQLITLPVVGGTGRFAGKKGTMTVSGQGKTVTEVFHLK